MILRLMIFTMALLLLANCRSAEKQENTPVNSENEKANILKVDQPIAPLNHKSKKLVEPWPEYQKFDEIIRQYEEVSMSEALLNSVELSELAQHLKDSIRIERLDIPSVKIRLNVIHNESLRLADMSTIPTITEHEILEANKNVINAFSALNLKINNMENMENLNSSIGEFINKVSSEKDSAKDIKADSIRTKK